MALQSIEGLAQLDAETCGRLRDQLRESGFDGAFLGEVESVAPLNLERPRRPLIRWFLSRRPGPAADLAALLCYFEALDRGRVEAALGAGLTERLLEAGVLVRDAGERLRTDFMMVPLGEQWFLSDPLDRGPEAVMGPGMTTLLLHRLLPELPAATVLDLGCGAGSLAIAAAARGARATATDISPRALAIAAFNARLNGVPLETRLGDVAGAVEGREFDLVLAQPPYLPRPENLESTTYLHGGRYGDELALRFVAGCARVLAPGGVAAVHFDSADRKDEPLRERLREAIGDAPAELLALVSPGPAPDLQAMFYAAMDDPAMGEEFARVATANRVHLESLGVTEISRVLALVRRPRTGERPGGRYRIVLQAPPVGRLRPGAVRESLQGLDLASGETGALLAARLAPPEDATFVGEWRSPADASPTRLEIKFGPGSMAQSRELGDGGWLLCGLFDGKRTVAEAFLSFAEAQGVTPQEAEETVTSFAREALARGMLRVMPGA
jgi:methylase of polypeptide subunit release factors